ncbi:uncharacterized protein HaLaN_03691, partial [Haematococcus lacustris]
EPAHLKAFVRRAAARLELRKHQEALQDIESGLDLEPGSKELLSMRAKAEKALGLGRRKLW